MFHVRTIAQCAQSLFHYDRKIVRKYYEMGGDLKTETTALVGGTTQRKKKQMAPLQCDTNYTWNAGYLLRASLLSLSAK